MDILDCSAKEMAEKIRNKEIKIASLLDRVYERIEKLNPEYNCFVSLCKESAYKNAEKLQEKIDEGEFISPLAGVPIGVKDNIVTLNIKTTCCSKMLENFVPTYNASVIENIERAGLIVVGKTNMDEFAMGSLTKTSLFGPTLNPFNKENSAGGSSGGSAAAVKLKLVPLALGSDTGGSVREPASFCGVIGLKPTYGKVSRRGLIAFASSLDTVGIFANFPEDCAELLNIISGRDERDSTSLESENIDIEDIKNFSFKDKKIAVADFSFSDSVSEKVKSSILDFQRTAEKLGAKTQIINLPILKYAVPAYYIISCAEASSNLSRYDSIRFGHRSKNCETLEEMYVNSRSKGFGLECKRRIMLGNFVLSADCFESYYKKALKIKRKIQEEYFKVLEKFDFILSPVYPTSAPKIKNENENPVEIYMGDIFTVGANLSGLAGISVPFSFDENNMPIGIELMSKNFCEGELLGACEEIMKNRGKENGI